MLRLYTAVAKNATDIFKYLGATRGKPPAACHKWLSASVFAVFSQADKPQVAFAKGYCY
jgi:hypothetical protein